MEPEVLLQKIDKLRSKYRGRKFDIEEGNPYIEESCELIEKFREESLMDFIRWYDLIDRDCHKRIINDYLKKQ